jgi:hypothetical protein
MEVVMGVLLTPLIVATLALGTPLPGQPIVQPPVIEIAAPGAIQELELKDGSHVVGRVESIAEGTFVFRTSAGAEMTVAVDAVRSLKVTVGRLVEGELWPADPNPTRLFFAPTGRALKQGEAYFGVYEILLPFIQVGITDRISFGGGTPLIFGGGEHAFWITPKVQIASGKSTAVAAGVLHFFIPDADVGIAYGVVTQGSTDSAASIGAGYAYANGDNRGSPVVMVGGEHRTSRRSKVVTENYWFRGGGLLSAGVRFLGESISADLGLVVPLNAEVFVAVPMVNFVKKF